MPKRPAPGLEESEGGRPAGVVEPVRLNAGFAGVAEGAALVAGLPKRPPAGAAPPAAGPPPKREPAC